MEKVLNEETNGARAVIGVTGAGVRLTVGRGAATVLDGVELGFSLGGLRLGVAPEQVSLTRRVIRDRFVLRSGKAIEAARLRAPRERPHLPARRGRGLAGDRPHRPPRGPPCATRCPSWTAAPRSPADHTAVPLPAGSRNWVLDYQTWYETRATASTPPTWTEAAYGLPFLTRLAPGSELLITESGIDGRFAGAHVRRDEGAPLHPRRRRRRGHPGVVTPWRVFLVGTSAELGLLAVRRGAGPGRRARAGGGRVGAAGPGGLVVVVGLLLRRAAGQAETLRGRGRRPGLGAPAHRLRLGGDLGPGDRRVREPAGCPGAPVDHLA